MNTILDGDPGIFYSLGKGYALFNQLVKAGPLELGDPIPLSCMFQGFHLLRNGQRVGHYFESQFKSSNFGGYIVAHLSKGPAESVEILLKTKELVVYHYPNRGTLIVSPTINDAVRAIFEEQ